MGKNTWLIVGAIAVVVLILIMSQKTTALSTTGTSLTGTGGILAGTGSLISGIGKGIGALMGGDSADSPGAGGYTPQIAQGNDGTATADGG